MRVTEWRSDSLVETSPAHASIALFGPVGQAAREGVALILLQTVVVPQQLGQTYTQTRAS